MTKMTGFQYVEWAFCLGTIVQPPLITENKHNCSLQILTSSHVLCSGRHDNQRAVTCTTTEECGKYYSESICEQVPCVCKSHSASIFANEENIPPKTSIKICTVDLISPKIEGHYFDKYDKSSSYSSDDRKGDFSIWVNMWHSPFQPALFMFIGLSLVIMISWWIYYVRKRTLYNLCCLSTHERDNNHDMQYNSSIDGAPSGDYDAPPASPEVAPFLVQNDEPPPYEVALQVSTMPKYLQNENYPRTEKI